MTRSEDTGGWKRSAAIALGLVVGVLAIYGQTLAFEFVLFDDDLYVTHNPVVQRGISEEGLRFAFARGGRSQGVTPHPLTWLSLMLDAEIYGVRAGGFHATNVVLHALSAALLFAALQVLTGAPWCSAAAAALWAWHPQRVESVAWVSERKDVLSAVFAILTIWCYARFAHSGSLRARWGSVLCFALGLLSKPTLIPLPFALLLLDYWPLRRRRPLAGLLFEKWPFFALSLLASLLTMEFHRGFSTGTNSVSPFERVANAAIAAAAYLEKFLWPSDLAPFYPHPYIPQSGGVPPVLGAIVLSALLLIVVSLAVLRARRAPYLVVGWLWFLGMLVPVLGFVQVGHQAFADRYTHLPSIGLGIAIVWGGAGLLALARASWLRRLILSLGVIALVALGCGAYAQTRTWRDSETFFRHALRMTPRATTMHWSFADWLRSEKRLEEAIVHYRIAGANDSGNPRLHFDLGRALYAQGRVDDAIEEYRLAARIEPGNSRTLYQLGLTYEIEGRLREAVEAYRAGLRVDPTNSKLRERLGIAEAKQRGR